MANRILCPVCCSEPSKKDVFGCSTCGFSMAFAAHFAGRESYNAWVKLIDSEKTVRLRELQFKFRSGVRFAISGDRAAYITESGKAIVVGPKIELVHKEPIRQISASENHIVFLYKNGSVKAIGNDNYGECNVGDLRDISFVLADSQSTYAIQSGRVYVRGMNTFEKDVSSWAGIISLASGAHHILGLRGDGTVLYAAERLGRSLFTEIQAWRSIVAIAAAGDRSLGLKSDGAVLYAGSKNDLWESTGKWKNVVAISADYKYAVGLTDEGNILLCGSVNPAVDMGRSGAVHWKNVVAIACSRSAIGALHADGTISLAGNIADSARLCEQWIPVNLYT